jgi:acyl-CoA synthetase (AMP-forming)/AMP-acid ligase II
LKDRSTHDNNRVLLGEFCVQCARKFEIRSTKSETNSKPKNSKHHVVNSTAAEQTVNVGLRLSETARIMPDGVAVVMPRGRDRDGKRRYEQVTFRELDEDSSVLAAGLQSMGVRPGTRLVLMVRPSIDFISLVFALFKAGVVTVLIDPGMGRRSLIKCLEDVEPEGFVAIPLAQAVRTLLKRRFPQARYNVTVGRRWFWGGPTIGELRSRRAANFTPVATKEDDPAAIIFTTGSTGPPKGVLYRHGNFNQQADEIRDFYNIQPGEIDLPGFPLFALFNCTMGVTTVIPDMDPTRPARVNPRNIIEAVRDWNVTQAFGSPALWNAVGRYCEEQHVKLPTLRRVLSAGAPVPPHVLRRMKDAIHPDGDVHTPYGATEALPVASISASEVLGETAARSQEGAGTCVGHKFPGIVWKVIRISDQPIATLDAATELPAGEIGELIVRGPVVTREYVTRVEANALHKICDGDSVWHRMGDVGYFDEQGRFWFCGRKAHRVLTPGGPMYTIRCEAIFNQHPRVYRSALVGVGEAGGQRPVIVVEPWPDRRPRGTADRRQLVGELLELGRGNPLTKTIRDILIHPSLPVDIRHNAKIFREKLAVWAAGRLNGGS